METVSRGSNCQSKMENKTTRSANTIRASVAQAALANMILATGVDKEDAIADLMTNLQHLCQIDPSFGKFEEEAARAVRNFNSDCDDDPITLMAGSSDPVIVVEINGGLVIDARASVAARVIILDQDTQGADAESLVEVDGTDSYVHDYQIGLKSPKLDPTGIAGDLQQIDAN